MQEFEQPRAQQTPYGTTPRKSSRLERFRGEAPFSERSNQGALPLDDSVDDQPPFNIRAQGVVTRRRSGRRVPPAGHRVQINRARPLQDYVDASS